jgi:digeranylgeranylglycerophospholipid reductase
MHDVIIIGAGPAGSHTARRLAENGCKVLVLEKNRQPGEKLSCTGIIGQECVNVFDIDSKVILRHLNSAALYAPSGNRLHISRPETQAVVLDRPAFDRFMAERGQKAGAEYQFNSRVTGINVENDRVTVLVSYHDKEIKVEARAAVLAAGFNPTLNEQSGLGTPRDYVTGAQAELEISNLEEVEVYFGDIAPGFFSWLVPTAPGRGKAGLLARRDAGPLLKKWLILLQQQGRINSADAIINYGSIPLRPPVRTYSERIIAVGDAAGQTKPTSGGGIYYGLIGAEAAAATLQSALDKDDLSVKSLAAYESAWRRKLGGELQKGYWARKFFEKLSEKQIDGLFNMIKAGGIDEALLKADDVSFDWHGRTINKLIKYRVITKTFSFIRRPGKSGIDRQHR